MGLKERLTKLERAAGQEYDTLTLPDGTEVRYPTSEVFPAIVALLEGEDHWLLPHLRQAEPKTGLPGLVWALEGDADVS